MAALPLLVLTRFHWFACDHRNGIQTSIELLGDSTKGDRSALTPPVVLPLDRSLLFLSAALLQFGGGDVEAVDR